MEKSSSKENEFPKASDLKPGDIISWMFSGSREYNRDWVLVLGKMHWKKRYKELDPVLEIPVVYFGKRPELRDLSFLSATFYEELKQRPNTIILQINEEK